MFERLNDGIENTSAVEGGKDISCSCLLGSHVHLQD